MACALGLLFLACGPRANEAETGTETEAETRIAAPPPTRLEPAQWLERQLAAGEVQAFEVALEAEHTLDLRVEQDGVDLVVTLLDLEGRPLLQVDTPSGADGSQGPERLLWVSDAPAVYGVTVKGLAHAGRYRIAVEAIRPATGSDRRRAAAELAVSRADLLYQQATRDARRQTIDLYRDALAAFQALADAPGEADALYRLGRSWQALAQHDRAIEVYERVRGRYRDLGNERQLAITLHNLCRIYNGRRELEAARDRCQRALALWPRVGDRRGQALSANESGLIDRRLGEGHRALTSYDRALALWRGLGNRAEEARTLHNRGRLYASLGRPEQALADLTAALAIRRRLGSQEAIAATLNSLAGVHARQGETALALALLGEALQATTDPTRRAITASEIARIQLQSGDTEQALAAFQQAAAVFAQQGEVVWQAQALQSIGWALTAQRRTAEARDCFQRALALAEGSRQRSITAEILLGIATAERQAGDLDAARARIESALPIIEDLRTDAAVADSDLRAYFFATKQRYYALYVDLLMALHGARPQAGHDRRALAASERSRARSLLDLLTASGQELERGADPALLARQRRVTRRINATELRLLWLLERPATTRQAVRRLEGEQRDLLREHQSIRGQIRASSPRHAALTQPAPLVVDDLQRQLRDGGETMLLSYRLGEARSFLWAVTADTFASYELPPSAEIEELTRRVHGAIARHQRQARQRLDRDLARLSEILLRPVGRRLRTAKRLLVVSDGALQYLPFAALPLPAAPADVAPAAAAPLVAAPLVATPLVASHEIVGLPSVSVIAALRERLHHRPPAPRTLAVVADPVFGPEDPRLAASGGGARPAIGVAGRRAGDRASLPRLAYAGLEAATILALVPAASRFRALGFEASRDVIDSGELGRYRIVHFATHGQLNTEHPELSRLMLSQLDAHGDPRDDGLLHAFELYGLELAAELVVLSACQTALGAQIRGEGLVGLTRGFMHAGAARVVVTLWNVNDRVTAELMGRFYRHLLVDAMPPAAALRAAQDAIRQAPRWQEPYYWAGFVLQGEWRDIRR